MVDKWGSWVANYGSKRIRLGVSIDPVVGSSYVDFSLGVYLEAEYAISDTSNSFNISGDWSRSTSSIAVSTPSGGGTDTLWALSGGHTIRKTGSPGQTVTASVSSYISGLFQDGAKASVSYSLSATIPAVVPTMGTTTATANVGSITVSWSVSNDGGAGIDYYHVYKNGSYMGQYTSTSLTDSVGNGVTASYKVYAHNSAGWSAESNTATATTPTVASAPQSFTANASTFGQISLSWSAPSSDGGRSVTSYVLRNGSTVLQDSASTSFVHTGLDPYTDYSYTVTAKNDVGESDASSLTQKTMGGITRIWNGTEYITVLPKVYKSYNSSPPYIYDWVDAQARMWNGTEWKHGI